MSFNRTRRECVVGWSFGEERSCDRAHSIFNYCMSHTITYAHTQTHMQTNGPRTTEHLNTRHIALLICGGNGETSNTSLNKRCAQANIKSRTDTLNWCRRRLRVAFFGPRVRDTMNNSHTHTSRRIKVRVTRFILLVLLELKSITRVRLCASRTTLSSTIVRRQLTKACITHLNSHASRHTQAFRARTRSKHTFV